MKSFKNRLIVAGLCSIAISACATSGGPKEGAGTAIGAGAGAVIGASVSSGEDRAKGMLIGAILGGVLGNRVGAMLDERDQLALQQKVLEVAATGESDKPVTWYSDTTGASAIITPMGNPEVETKIVQVSQESDVTVRGIVLEQVAGTRVTQSNLNLRMGPSTAFEIKRVLPRGMEYSVIGKTENGWYLLSEDGAAIGWVSGVHLRHPGEEAYSGSLISGDSEAVSSEALESDESRTRPTYATEEVDVTITRVCRPVIIRVKDESGRISEETANTCKDNDGSWGA